MAGMKYFEYTPKDLVLRDAAGLSSQFGNIDYDEASIKKKFDAATAAEYATKNKEFRTTEDKYYNNLYSLGQTTAQSVRNPYASAIMNGQNLAAMATPQLSALMNLQSQSVTGATELARALNLLKQRQAEAYTKNAVDANSISTQRKTDLGNLAANLYGTDAQAKAASDAYWAALEQGQATLAGTQYASDASVRAAQVAADAQVQIAAANRAATQSKTRGTPKPAPKQTVYDPFSSKNSKQRELKK